MKLQKLNLEQLEKYRLENPIRILGGGTCIYTCCSSSGGTTNCGDSQSDDGDTQPMQ